jgi:hypothetical protein
MRLRDKDGGIAFYASDPAAGTSWPLPVESYLSPRQYDQMKDHPDMILRFAHYLAHTLADAHPDVKIHVTAMMSLNSRAPQLLLDPTVDLVRIGDNLLASDWILPLVQPPVPHEPVPALLITRRYEGVMLLVNTTEAVYPLDQLTMYSGASPMLSGADIGIATLQPGECVMAHTPDADLQAVFAPCNETGTRILLEPDHLNGPLRVEVGDRSTRCDGAACMVTAGSTPVSLAPRADAAGQ